LKDIFISLRIQLVCMTYLDIPETLLLEKGALHTAREIAGQPDLWLETWEKFIAESEAVLAFLKAANAETTQIVLTGAGTSAYIGLSLQGVFSSRMHKISTAIPTTDILSHPQHYFRSDDIPLIVSFARSGKSPESCAALELADRFCKKCFHLIITCNEQGALANYQSKNPTRVFVLPPKADDKSLAMTGSYSSMLLTGLLVAFGDNPSFCTDQVQRVVLSAKKIISHEIDQIRKIAAKEFERAVFLGSGALFGTATEAGLKLQELTDGQIICKADSYLGFRHGPKAVIDEATLVVYFFSNNNYVTQYEYDLLPAMKTGNRALFQWGITEQEVPSTSLDGQIILTDNGDVIAEEFLPLCSIIPGQLLAFFKSLQLKLMPDSPSVSGAISRVVEGVNIYPVAG
jgi:tagatose-6-phosphate ketose/aldose isomerase